MMGFRPLGSAALASGPALIPTYLTIGAASLTLSSAAPGVLINVIKAPAAAGLTLTAATPNFFRTQNAAAAPAAGGLTLVGNAPVVNSTNASSIQPGSAATLTLTGSVPIVTATQSRTFAPAAGTLTLTGARIRSITPVPVLLFN